MIDLKGRFPLLPSATTAPVDMFNAVLISAANSLSSIKAVSLTSAAASIPLTAACSPFDRWYHGVPILPITVPSPFHGSSLSLGGHWNSQLLPSTARSYY